MTKNIPTSVYPIELVFYCWSYHCEDEMDTKISSFQVSKHVDIMT